MKNIGTMSQIGLTHPHPQRILKAFLTWSHFYKKMNSLLVDRVTTITIWNTDILKTLQPPSWVSHFPTSNWDIFLSTLPPYVHCPKIFCSILVMPLIQIEYVFEMVKYHLRKGVKIACKMRTPPKACNLEP